MSLNNPYEYLGVSTNATEEEIIKAYKRIGKDITLSNESESEKSRKMSELDNAYDTIINKLRGTSYSSGNNESNNYYETSQYSDIRHCLNSGRIDDAEMLLDGVPSGLRDAEWYFLKGVVHKQRGWLNESYTCFEKACSMDPSNSEYAAAFNSLKNNAHGGYKTSRKSDTGKVCALCSGLICANLCCEFCLKK